MYVGSTTLTAGPVVGYGERFDMPGQNIFWSWASVFAGGACSCVPSTGWSLYFFVAIARIILCPNFERG